MGLLLAFVRVFVKVQFANFGKALRGYIRDNHAHCHHKFKTVKSYYADSPNEVADESEVCQYCGKEYRK